MDPRYGTLLEKVFELAGRLNDGMAEELEGHGLTTARAELLWRLGADGPLTQRRLSEDLRCTPRNVTGLVDALEAAALVRREVHPTDRRAILVTLTDAGRATLQRWQEGFVALAGQMFAPVPAEDLQGFEATLEHILTQLRSADGSMGAASGQDA